MVGFAFLFYGLFFLRIMLSDRVASAGLGLAGLSRRNLGLWGSALTLLAVLYLAAVMVLVVDDFADFFSDIMPRTPEAAFRGMLLLLTTFTLLQGVEPLGRVGLIMLPVVVSFILAGILGSLTIIDLRNILPLAERGADPLIKAGFMHLSYTSELFALGFLAGSLGNSGGGVRRASYRGLLINVVFFFLISIFLVAALGEGHVMRSNFKLFALFRYGPQGFTTGYESLFIVVWVIIFFMKAALIQGAIGAALAEITPVGAGVYHVAAGLLAFIIGFYVFDNRVVMIMLYSDYYPAPVVFFTLLFLALANLFSGRGGKGGG